MSWQDQVEAVNPPQYEDGTDYPPRVWWFNGVRQARTAVVFYTKLEEHPGPLPVPWTVSHRFDGEVGYEATTLRIAVIGMRQEPFIPETDPTTGQKRRRFIKRWETGAQLYNEWLCFIDPLSYPVVLCSKGLTGKALAVAWKGYKTRVLKPAERMVGRALPAWSFWLPITGMVDERGRPFYADTGHGSFVTPPALVLPDAPEAALAESLFVGADVLAAGVQVRQEYDGWLKERRVEQPAAVVAASDDAPPMEDPTDYSGEEVPW